MTLALLLSQAARAQSTEPGASELQTARELFADAEKDEREGSWAIALEKMRRVGRIKMTPGIRVHIAACEERLGQLVAALADAQAEAEKNQDVKKLMKEPLEALQARVPRVLIKVPPDVKGLEVVLDGKPLVHGVLGMAMPVDARQHQLEASAPGFRVFRASFSGTERQRAEVSVRLEPVGDRENARGDAQKDRAPAVLATAAAVVLVGAGLGAYFVADGQQSGARDACARSPACDDVKSGVRTWDALALSAWIGAGVATAVAIVLWTKPTEKSRAALMLHPGRVSIEGSF